MSVLPWPTAWLDRNLQWQMLSLLPPTAVHLRKSQTIMWNTRRHTGGRNVARTAGLPQLGALSTTSYRLERPVLAGSASRTELGRWRRVNVALDQRKRAETVVLELARLECAAGAKLEFRPELCSFRRRKRLAMERNELQIEPELHLSTSSAELRQARTTNQRDHTGALRGHRLSDRVSLLAGQPAGRTEHSYLPAERLLLRVRSEM